MALDALFFVGFVGRLVVPSFLLVGPVALGTLFFLFGAEVRWLLMHPPPKKKQTHQDSGRCEV